MSRPRLSEDPASRLHSIQSFGELSHFLRAAVADEEALKVSDSMGEVAAHIEVVAAFLVHPKNADSAPQLAQMLMDLLNALRNHAALLEALDAGWHSQYEFKSYAAAIKQFRRQVGQWAREARDPQAPPLSAVEFELNAWRLLGLGALLIDVHEQPITMTMEAEPPRPPAGLMARARSWLARLTS